MTASRTLVYEAPSMRMPCVRFTIRWMMLAIVVAAIPLGLAIEIERWGPRAERYRRESKRLAGLEQSLLRSLQETEADRERNRLRVVAAESPDFPWESEAYLSPQRFYRFREARLRGDAAAILRRASHYATLREKYSRAMVRPWLPVAPDPPEPE